MATAIREHPEEVRVLDATIGDGDLGVTVELMARAMVEFADSRRRPTSGEPPHAVRDGDQSSEPLDVRHRNGFGIHGRR